jgi:ankyrin repeat protein
MATALLDLGVPSEARDDLGWTALMGVDSPALARALLAGKANPNARDKDESTPLLSTDDDRVALILLRAGADPRVRNENGTLRAQAVKQHMPATLAWLDEHKIQ